MNEVRIQLLLDKFRCGNLEEPERRELERELLSSPAARALFWREARFHALLARWGQESWGSRMAAAVPPRESFTRIRRGWWIGLAAAAVLIIAGMSFLVRLGSRTPAGEPKIAVLALASGAKWTNAGYAPGALLAPGWLELKSGVVEIEFFTGARVVVEGPAEFRLVSRNEGFLNFGKITAHVPPQAHGFKVDSSDVTVTDYGTDFGFAVWHDQPSEVHVFNGRVEISPFGMERRVLTSGEAVRIEAGGLQNIEANQASFPSEAELAMHDDLEEQQRFSAWEEASGLLSRDPATLLYYNFERQLPDPPVYKAGGANGVTQGSNFERQLPKTLVLLNQAGGANGGTQGTIVGCTWAAGRWPGKKALDFRGGGDRVRISVPQNMTRLTFLAWVRVDSLSNGFHSLLSADTEQAGSLRWELTQTGRLRFSIGRDLGHSNTDWEAVNSDAFMMPDRFGQWLMLVTTFDGSKVRHFCNGESIGSGFAYSPPNLIIGTADVGNTQVIGMNTRRFMGSMDELAILDRAMSEEEVRRFYEAGRP
ncbi:MAG: LamG-like jellyroll fold domain-containing protein [Verrucomicrobiota bacterium]